MALQATPWLGRAVERVVLAAVQLVEGGRRELAPPAVRPALAVQQASVVPLAGVLVVLRGRRDAERDVVPEVSVFREVVSLAECQVKCVAVRRAAQT